MTKKDGAAQRPSAAELAEARNWGRCQGCDMERRIVDVGGVKVMCEHNRYDGQMVWCQGSGQPPQAESAPPPEATFTDAPVGAEQR